MILKYNAMNRNKLKIAFFQNEIDTLLQLRQNLQAIGQLLRKSLVCPEPDKQQLSVKLINRQLLSQISLVRQQIYDTRRYCDPLNDQSRIEEQVLFRCHEDKIQQNNHRLFQAEKLVQQAEDQRKEASKNEPHYEMSRYKNYTRRTEFEGYEGYIQAEDRLTGEFVRGIQLLMKVKGCKIGHFPEERRLMMGKSKGVRFLDIRRNQKQIYTQRRARSQQKGPLQYTEQSLFISRKDRGLPRILSLFQYDEANQKKFKQLAMGRLIKRLKESNLRHEVQGKLLSAAIQARNRDKFRRYLQEKSDLEEEENVMKLELIAEQFNKNIMEKLISLKPGRACRDFIEGSTRHLASPSQPKHKSMCRIHSSPRTPKKQPFPPPAKPDSSSHPRTNDSLTPALVAPHL